MPRHLLRRLAAAASAWSIVALGASTAATAQEQGRMVVRGFSPRMGEDPGFLPSVTQREVDQCVRTLSLDDAQKVVADELYTVYTQEFRTEADATRRALKELEEEVRATGDFRIYGDKIGPLIDEWLRRRDEFENRFFGELQSVLYEHQMEAWPRVERDRRRARLLPNARLGGEDVDLIRLVGDRELTDEVRATVEPLLEQYAIELDSALQQRDAALEPLEKQWAESFGDRDRLAELWEQATRKRAIVRDVNERSLLAVIGVLPQAEGDALRKAYDEAAFPTAFEETRADRLFEILDEYEGLTAEQAATIDTIEAQYLDNRKQLNRRLIAELVKAEKELPPFIRNMQVQPAGGRFGGGQAITVIAATGEDEQYGGLLRERFNLSKTACTSVESVLTAEQRGGLPEIDMSDSDAAFFRGVRFNL
jgi:hypothetical protein